MSIPVGEWMEKFIAYKGFPLAQRVPIILKKVIPFTAILCDMQVNEKNQLCWAIIYQDGSDTFVCIYDNEVYIEGEHEKEISDAIHLLLKNSSQDSDILQQLILDLPLT